ncbi:MAG: hydrogenase maturation nickel metallochaperone HypA [Cyclobacteriaceae bacterium]|nr:hydrogenase maturation nickel metallochaperone HypA [Cyclobacteriaceae bacterium]
MDFGVYSIQTNQFTFQLTQYKMHEVSIAMSILQIIEEELSRNPGKAVVKVHLQIGVLSGVVPDSLLFALEASRQNGPLKNAKISIDNLKGFAHCPDCGKKFETEDYFGVCPECGNSRYDIISGRELLIKSITLV